MVGLRTPLLSASFQYDTDAGGIVYHAQYLRLPARAIGLVTLCRHQPASIAGGYRDRLCRAAD